MGKGIDLNTIIIVGGAVAAIYFLKDIFKSSEEIAAEKTDRVESRQENKTERVEIRNQTVRDIFGNIFGNNGSNNQAPTYDNAGTVSAANPVTKAEIKGTAYGFDTHTITTPKGKSTIVAAPNTYYKDLGVGFNAAGQGYSSAFAGNKAPSQINATNIFTKAY